MNIFFFILFIYFLMPTHTNSPFTITYSSCLRMDKIGLKYAEMKEKDVRWVTWRINIYNKNFFYGVSWNEKSDKFIYVYEFSQVCVDLVKVVAKVPGVRKRFLKRVEKPIVTCNQKRLDRISKVWRIRNFLKICKFTFFIFDDWKRLKWLKRFYMTEND